jgi:CubicO group peptidase (beta-lactamase class C family)
MITVPEENAPHIGRALGWDNRSSAAGIRGDLFSRTRTICHTGYTGTSMVIDMDSKTTVIFLTNRVHPVDKSGLARTRALLANIVAASIEE